MRVEKGHAVYDCRDSVGPVAARFGERLHHRCVHPRLVGCRDRVVPDRDAERPTPRVNKCGRAATNSATVLLPRGHAGALGVGANHEEERDGYRGRRMRPLVKAYLGSPRDDDGSYRFAPHFARTLGSINYSLPTRLSDHDPISVDLSFEEPVSLRDSKAED